MLTQNDFTMQLYLTAAVLILFSKFIKLAHITGFQYRCLDSLTAHAFQFDNISRIGMIYKQPVFIQIVYDIAYILIFT